MCGIFGYIGPRTDAADITLDGLKTLEYRGYDSWGIAATATQHKQDILLEKYTGKIGNATLGSQLSIPTSLAIGHTRWATHGGVTVANAHPHTDCKKQIALLHNGIVENYQELKDKLLANGHTFVSETDTEVITHLLEEHATNKSFYEAVQHTFAHLKGMNAIVAIHKEKQEIVAAKNGSPLVVGVGDNEYFLASDPAGVLPYTRRILFLKDNEMVVLNDHITLYNLPEGTEIKPEIEEIDWQIEQAVKGTYEHFMLKEMHDQPHIIETIATTSTDQIKALAEVIEKAKGTFFIGSGTAYHACLAGTYLFSKIAKKHVNTAPASEFNYLEDFLNSDSLIVPLSQSGETIDVIEPLTRAKEKNSKILALVNVLGSTIYRMADEKLLLGAGPEKAVASTKAYVAKITVLYLLASAVRGTLEDAKHVLLQTAQEVQRLLQDETASRIQKLADRLKDVEHIYIIGRGFSYATALEGALKIKEVSYIHTEGLAGGELKHGSIALIEKGVPCIVIAPDDETHDAVLSNAMEIKSRGGFIIGLSSKYSPIFDEWIEVRETEGHLITHIIPMQLLAYYLALAKHLDPDKPRNLAKSVTVK